MSRLKNFSRNLAASYLQFGVSSVYALVSIPLILHWLPKPEFGLWALLGQWMGYIALVDLGINSAIARFLVDHKDQRETGHYGALVKTSALVSVAQGLIVLAVVTVGSPLLASLMNIPAEYHSLFVTLMRLQGVIAAFNFCTNPLSIMLNAHQRMDVVTVQGMWVLVAGLALLVLFLISGCGIYAFIYSSAITSLAGPAYLFWNCRRLGFIPRRGEWGKTSWHLFNEVFLYGKDVFLIGLGAQMITASQTIIISRTLGLDAAAAWAVGTKIFNMVRQLVFQPFAAAVPGLAEMIVRHEQERLCHRFRNLVVLIASLGVLLGAGFALCNSLFVEIWTARKISWQPLNDVLLAAWLLVACLQCTHCNLVTITKQIGAMRYLYFVEGCVFVLGSLLLGGRGGVPAILGYSVLCSIIFSYQFGLLRSRRYFHVPLSEIAWEWVRPTFNLAVLLYLPAWGLWHATSGLPAILRLAIHAVAAGIGGGYLFLRFGLPATVVREAGSRLPRPAARLLGIVVPCTTP